MHFFFTGKVPFSIVLFDSSKAWKVFNLRTRPLNKSEDKSKFHFSSLYCGKGIEKSTFWLNYLGRELNELENMKLEKTALLCGSWDENYWLEEMRMIGFQGGDLTLQSPELLAVNREIRPPVLSLVDSSQAELWLVSGERIIWARGAEPGLQAGAGAESHALWTNIRNTGQSSATPHHCDTEILRVRKILVLCFSLQKRTTKIGHNRAGFS